MPGRGLPWVPGWSRSRHPYRDSRPPASGPGSRSPPAAVPGSSWGSMEGDLRSPGPPRAPYPASRQGQHLLLLAASSKRVSSCVSFQIGCPQYYGSKGPLLHSSGEHRQDNTNFLQLYGEISYRFLYSSRNDKRSASFGSRDLCVSSITLGDDGAVRAGVAAGTAVQASGSIDDVLVIALADSTGGAKASAQEPQLTQAEVIL